MDSSMSDITHDCGVSVRSMMTWKPCFSLTRKGLAVSSGLPSRRNIHFRWPVRLTVAWILFALSIVLALPAVQLARSTARHPKLEATEQLLPLLPILVLIPALAVSTLRNCRASEVAKWLSVLLLGSFVAAVLVFTHLSSLIAA